MFLVVLDGFKCLLWFWVVSSGSGGFGWFPAFVVVLGCFM